VKGPCRVEFMPIKDGDVVDLMDSYQGHTIVHEFGFKPGPARSRSGWLVLLVHEGDIRYTDYQGKTSTVSIPKSVRPHQIRGRRGILKGGLTVDPQPVLG
jgi:hypothetical protein